MAYQAVLINRLAQFGKVDYDMVVTDTGKPTYRHSVSLPLSQDTTAKRAEIMDAAQVQAEVIASTPIPPPPEPGDDGVLIGQAPQDAYGKNGDLWIDNVTFNVYLKQFGTWT